MTEFASSFRSLSSRHPAHAERTLVVVSTLGLPDCLLFALRREFSSINVVVRQSLERACEAFDPPVALLLADAATLHKSVDGIAAFRRCHPLANICALVESDAEAAIFHESDMRTGSIRGLLPMNLKLDLWLSVVALLLRGGEYYPASLLRRAEHADGATYKVASDRTAMPPLRVTRDLSMLTAREMEILRHVSRGTQNKLIAVALGLSENTVKIHMHNVIRKLGTRNRTEAAAVFLQSAAAPVGSPANNGTAEGY
jgi:DNA-binding NarL/FixJ family response regulator